MWLDLVRLFWLAVAAVGDFLVAVLDAFTGAFLALGRGVGKEMVDALSWFAFGAAGLVGAVVLVAVSGVCDDMIRFRRERRDRVGRNRAAD